MPWLPWLLALLAVNAMAVDPLLEAQARFRALDGYRVTLRSVSADGQGQIIRYAWRKPGWIRMDFVQPHNGTVMILDPAARRVRLWPFGARHLPPFNLSPDNPLIRGPRGHQLDHSDVGALLANLTALREQGSMAAPADALIAGRPATTLEITGAAGASVAGVHRFRVWLARETLFPLQVQSFGADGELIETVDMGDAELDPPFPERFFTP